MAKVLKTDRTINVMQRLQERTVTNQSCNIAFMGENDIDSDDKVIGQDYSGGLTNSISNSPEVINNPWSIVPVDLSGRLLSEVAANAGTVVFSLSSHYSGVYDTASSDDWPFQSEDNSYRQWSSKSGKLLGELGILRVDDFRGELEPQRPAATDSLLGGLEEYYVLRNKEHIEDYIKNYPLVRDFLFAAYSELRRHFGASPELILEVVCDPEYGGRTFFVYVRTNMSVENAINQLSAFDEAWFLDQVNKYGDLVGVNLEVI